MKMYFGKDSAKTRALKVLALLVESGCLYCALLVRYIFYCSTLLLEHQKLKRKQVFVIVYQLPTETDGDRFSSIGYYLTYGCFVPLVVNHHSVLSMRSTAHEQIIGPLPDYHRCSHCGGSLSAGKGIATG